MTRRVTSAEFIGRAAELEAIRTSLDETRTGSPVHVLVAGEAGVGKSRLLAQSAADATATGWTVLRGGSIDLGEGSLPFGPWVELLRGWMRQVGRPAAVAMAGPAAPDLARLVPELEPAEVRLPPDRTLQARIPDALLDFLTRLSDRSPTLIQLEDLHWADAGTLSATAYLLRAIDGIPVSIIASYRIDEMHRRHPLLHWLAEVSRSTRILRLDLAPFRVDEVAALVSGVLGSAPSLSVVEEVHRRSDGNPFFAEELLASGTDGAALPLTSTLRDLLSERIARVSEPAHTMLGVIAVAGREVDHELLAEVAGDDVPDPRDSLREVIEAGLLIPVMGQADDRYAFRHCLLQEAVYDELLPAERRRLHRDIARVLESRDPAASDAGRSVELAYHWREARDVPRAFVASIRAGDAAASAFAFSQARDEYEQALAMWSSVPDPQTLAGIDRIDLLRRTGRAAYMINDGRRAVALYKEAVELADAQPDRVRTSVVLEEYGRVLFVAGSTTASIEACERAVAIIRAEPQAPERPRVISGLAQAYMLEGNYLRSIELCREAIALARELGVRSAEGHALNTLGIDLASIGQCGEAVDSLEAALAIGLELRDPDDIGRAYVNLTDSLWLCGQSEGALARANEALGRAAELGIAPSYGFFLRANALSFACVLGDWATARRMLREGEARIPDGIGSEVYWHSYTLPFRVASGSTDAEQAWLRARQLMSRYERAYTAGPPVELGGAELAIWQGRPDEALELAEGALARLADTEAVVMMLQLCRLGARAGADLAAGMEPATVEDTRHRVEAMRATVTRALDRVGDSLGSLDKIVHAELATIDAELARLAGEPTIERWRTVRELWLERPWPYLAAYAGGQLAAAAGDGGDRDEAVKALRDAYGIAARLGAVPLLAWLERIGRRLRIQLAVPLAGDGIEAPSTGPAEHAFGLTGRELEVLALVVAGRTNRQIAEELFISHNTAGVHVSNILGKMGVSSRTEAASTALQSGLVGR